MNITSTQQYFWGGDTLYVPSSLEYYLFFINNFTWIGIFLTYYYNTHRSSDLWIPTYSYMVKQYPPLYIHLLGWFIGFYIRMFSIIQRRCSTGLTLLILLSLFFYIGNYIYPTNNNQLQFSRSNSKHIFVAIGVFTMFYILLGFYCINRIEFQIKFALLLLSTRIKWKKYILFSIMEHICIHHACVYSYPLIGV